MSQISENFVPDANLPRHVAIIMDGNGRWAKQRYLPRIAGHRAGVESVRATVENCAKRKIEALTLFAFSSENWRRPEQEVGMLMDLFLTALQRETRNLHQNNVRIRIIGERTVFSSKLQKQIDEGERITANNTGLTLNIATNYGGRWDIVNAVRQLSLRIERGELKASEVTEQTLQSFLTLQDIPEPDLFIRTGGEQRLSNFLLWHLAYTELYFTDTLWPDFKDDAFAMALTSFAKRQRRFGRTGEQVEQGKGA